MILVYLLQCGGMSADLCDLVLVCCDSACVMGLWPSSSIPLVGLVLWGYVMGPVLGRHGPAVVYREMAWCYGAMAQQ